MMGLGFRRTSLPPRGCSRLFPELSWWDCTPSFRRLESIFIWHTFSHSDLLWRWGRRGATSFNVSTHDPSRITPSVVAFRSAPRKNEHITERGDGAPNLPPEPEPRTNDSATMSAPLPPYSTFRTDNKVRQPAAGPAGGRGSAGGRRKFTFPERTVRPFSGGARKIPGPEWGSVGGHPGPSWDLRPAERAVINVC